MQVCLERGLSFTRETNGKASACLQQKYINKCNQDKKKAIKEYEAAKANKQQNPDLYNIASVALMSLPDQSTVTYEAGCIECNCCSCCLRREQDFAQQRSGIEEAFDRYNTAKGTKHRCLFLPKFHPELNYIERIWARMKYYIRKHCDNKFETMRTSIETAMGSTNLPLAMIRRFARTSFAYMYAYQAKMDIIAAHDWVKEHRQHRGFRKSMDLALDSTPYSSDTVDSKLHKLYHPTVKMIYVSMQ